MYGRSEIECTYVECIALLQVNCNNNGSLCMMLLEEGNLGVCKSSLWTAWFIFFRTAIETYLTGLSTDMNS